MNNETGIIASLIVTAMRTKDEVDAAQRRLTAVIGQIEKDAKEILRQRRKSRMVVEDPTSKRQWIVTWNTREDDWSYGTITWEEV